jgi:hypothetical protein
MKTLLLLGCLAVAGCGLSPQTEQRIGRVAGALADSIQEQRTIEALSAPRMAPPVTCINYGYMVQCH